MSITALSPPSEMHVEFHITPPTTESDPQSEQILFVAFHVLSTEATALSHLSRLYATEPVAHTGFVKAVEGIKLTLEQGGKLVVIGVGKSGRIGEKFVSTMNSLGLQSVFLHPVEALHGDLGILRPHDIILMITYSGNTPELLALLPHIPAHVPRIVLTSHTNYNTTKLTCSWSNTILLPAPIPEREEVTFGVPAPTTSTTVAMALSDALAMAVSKVLHGGDGSPGEVFKRNHPGGVIGLDMGIVGVTISDLAIPLKEIPTPPTESSDDGSVLWSPVAQVPVLDCLLLAVRSRGGWLKTAKGEVVSPRLLQRVTEPAMSFRNEELGLVVPEEKWVKVPGNASIDEARRSIMATRTEDFTGSRMESLVVATVVDGKVVGVIEYGELSVDGR
ncbi:hypothetical protein EV426DRAFT_660512 [Tirmania nivea]|nr:hypothetical protein EV426DRAFT_660512 [Tirmania nivea]